MRRHNAPLLAEEKQRRLDEAGVPLLLLRPGRLQGDLHRFRCRKCGGEFERPYYLVQRAVKGAMLSEVSSSAGCLSPQCENFRDKLRERNLAASLVARGGCRPGRRLGQWARLEDLLNVLGPPAKPSPISKVPTD